jgi:hypothetical protein
MKNEFQRVINGPASDTRESYLTRARIVEAFEHKVKDPAFSALIADFITANAAEPSKMRALDPLGQIAAVIRGELPGQKADAIVRKVLADLGHCSIELG